MQNVFTIDADIKLKMLINEPTVVQNDAIRFIINVFDNGQPLDLTNVETISLASVRLDRQTIVTPGTKIDTNIVQFDLGTEETKVPGRVEATAQFYDSEGRVSTISFSYRVIKDPTGDGYIPTEREQTLIETVLGDGPLIIQQAQDAANFANEQGQFAQTQANAASEAAQNANDAAQSATNAANEANTAAQSANTAAASANAAADNANTKATNAQTQADYAQTQGDFAQTQGNYAKSQGDYAKTQGDYAKSIADQNKTRWLTPVANFAAIATTYPNPQHGDTVMTLDDGKIYRYENGQWKFTQQYNSTALNNLANELSKQNKQSATIGHGLNIINASQNSPLDVRIEGWTLVNLLGIQGRTATSATVTLDSAKYYVLVNEDGTNVTVDGVSQTVPYKFTRKSSVSLSWTSGKVALYEVDAAEYNNILTTWTTSEVNRRYPYVDSVQHVQNPYVIAEGENLLPPFTEWTLHANAVVREPYKLELNATEVWQQSSVTVNVVGGQTYTLSAIGSGATYHKIVAGSLVTEGVGLSKTFTVPTGVNTATIYFSNYASGKITFSNPILTLGSQTKPFVSRNPSTLFAEVKLGSLADKKDILFKENGDWKKLKWIEDVILDGGLEWVFLLDGTNFKKVYTRNILPNTMNGRPYELVKYNGLPSRKDYNGGEGAYVGDNDYNVFLSILDTDSGWGESYTPSSSEIKAYFWGWRMCNGTYGQPYDGTGTKTWYPIGDTDLSRAVTTCPTSAAPTIAEGKIGYYKLSYVRQTPVTEVVTDKVEGDLVVNELTQIEVGSGVIVREKVTPVLNTEASGDHYQINRIGITSSFTKNRVQKFFFVYKNGVNDTTRWNRMTTNVGNGLERMIIKKSDFDPTAEYTITYLLLDRHLFTTNILAVTATYDSSLKSVVDSVVAKQSDIAAQVSVNVRAIAELYKRIKALGG